LEGERVFDITYICATNRILACLKYNPKYKKYNFVWEEYGMAIDSLKLQIREAVQALLEKSTEEDALDILVGLEVQEQKIATEFSDEARRLRELRNWVQGQTPRRLVADSNVSIQPASSNATPSAVTVPISAGRVNEIVSIVDEVANRLAGKDAPKSPSTSGKE
jgi:hypothetical protein